MPDRHGPMRVIYQSGDIPSTTWDSFEEDTPNQVLDRMTESILDIDPAWLGGALTANEVGAVQEWFDVSIGDGEPEPIDPFGVERFELSANYVDGGVQDVYVQARVVDSDGSKELAGLEVEAASSDGASDSFEYLPDGADSGANERSDFEIGLFLEQTVTAPVDVTLSAIPVGSDSQPVELETKTVEKAAPT